MSALKVEWEIGWITMINHRHCSIQIYDKKNKLVWFTTVQKNTRETKSLEWL